MDKKKFFDSVRASNSGIFDNTLSQVQVDSMNAILDNADGFPLSWLAYTMATAYGETGMDYSRTENMNYTSAARIEQVFSNERRLGIPGSQLVRNPQKLANTVYSGILGNGGPDSGDGWKYRGHGLPQVTGRTNFEKVRRLTGLEVVANPSLLLSPVPSARALLAAMEAGIYTGKKAADYLPREGKATREQFRQARRIINGMFAADKFAGYALAFQDALIKANYAPRRVSSIIPQANASEPVAPAPAPKLSWLADLIQKLLRLK